MTVKTEEKVPEKEIVKQAPPVDTSKEPTKEETPQETQEQINWRKFREAREQERKEMEAAKKREQEKAKEVEALKAALDSVLAKPSPQKHTLDDIDDEPQEDVIAKKVEEVLTRERQKEEALRREREAREMPARLNTTYSDFNKIVTTENLDYLEYHYPGVANAFKRQEDSFDKWASIYTTIKQLIPNSDNKRDQKTLEKNATKPVSPSVAGMATSGDHAPVELTEQRRKDNWMRMQRVLKGIK